MTLEQRVMELEVRLSFQDDTIASLNRELAEQGRLIERLQLQIRALAQRQEDLVGHIGVDEGDAPPPHY